MKSERKGETVMQKIVEFQIKERQTNFEKLRDIYKKDFQLFIDKKEKYDNTIHFRNYENRERM